MTPKGTQLISSLNLMGLDMNIVLKIQISQEIKVQSKKIRIPMILGHGTKT